MALVVEDGTGLATAESYISVADVGTYITKWYPTDTSWSGSTTAEQEAACRQATRYLDGQYGSRWFGSRVLSTQALDWPRSDVVDRDGFSIDDDSVPQEVLDATAEMAYRYIQGDRFFSVDTDPTSVTAERLKIGPLEIDKEYAGVKDATTVTEYPLTDKLVSRYIHSSGTIRRA